MFRILKSRANLIEPSFASFIYFDEMMSLSQHEASFRCGVVQIGFVFQFSYFLVYLLGFFCPSHGVLGNFYEIEIYLFEFLTDRCCES